MRKIRSYFLVDIRRPFPAFRPSGLGAMRVERERKRGGGIPEHGHRDRCVGSDSVIWSLPTPGLG